MSRPLLAALFTCFMLVLPLTAHADLGPRAYAHARAPMPEEEVAALTKKLEALSAKKAWKEADVLATKSLGAQWCADAIALPFRTFAALGVIARRSKKSELALTCTLRSLYAAAAADTGVLRSRRGASTSTGQALFELSLLVDAMSSKEFIAYRKRERDVAVAHSSYDSCRDGVLSLYICCDNSYGEVRDKIMAEGGYTIENDESQQYHEDAHEQLPKQAHKQFRKRIATKFLIDAYNFNPSPAVAKRLTARLGDASGWASWTTSQLPSRLEPLHVASSHEEARTWLLEHARKRTFRNYSDQSTKIKDVLHRKTVSQAGLSVSQTLILHSVNDDESKDFTTHYLIVHMKGSSEHLVFVDPEQEGYVTVTDGHSSIESPRFKPETKASTPFFSVPSGTSFDYNDRCDPFEFSVARSQVIYCSVDEVKTPRCLVWSNPPHGVRRVMDTQMGLLAPENFTAHSASMQALIAPVANASFMEVYDAIPGLQEQIHGWFTAP